MKKVAFLLFGALTACVSAEPEELRGYPDGFLCQLLDPNQYISTPQEQINVHRELDRRGLKCVAGAVTAK